MSIRHVPNRTRSDSVKLRKLVASRFCSGCLAHDVWGASECSEPVKSVQLPPRASAVGPRQDPTKLRAEKPSKSAAEREFFTLRKTRGSRGSFETATALVLMQSTIFLLFGVLGPASRPRMAGVGAIPVLAAADNTCRITCQFALLGKLYESLANDL